MPNACTAGQASPPITAGAWNQAMRSTRSARSSEAASCAPPSTRTRVIPASPSAASAADRIDAGLGPGDLDQRDTEIGEGVTAVAIGAVADQHPGRRLRGRGDQRRGERRAQMAVGDDPHHRAGAVAGQAAGQLRIVRQHRADADHHRVMPAAQRMGRTARGLAGDPAALARPRGDPAIQRGGELQRHQRTPQANPRAEPRHQFVGRVLQHAFIDRDAGRAQPRDARRRPPAGPDRAWRSPRGRRRH